MFQDIFCTSLSGIFKEQKLKVPGPCSSSGMTYDHVF
jgi:hypothetical protein